MSEVIELLVVGKVLLDHYSLSMSLIKILRMPGNILRHLDSPLVPHIQLCKGYSLPYAYVLRLIWWIKSVGMGFVSIVKCFTICPSTIHRPKFIVTGCRSTHWFCLLSHEVVCWDLVILSASVRHCLIETISAYHATTVFILQHRTWFVVKIACLEIWVDGLASLDTIVGLPSKF